MTLVSPTAAPAPESASASPGPAPAPPERPRVWRAPPDKRRAIVVGASSGMGAALVRQLAREGYRVGLLARRAELLEELAEGCAADCAKSGGALLTRAHDVSDSAAVAGLFEELVRGLGGLDLLIYAAGIMPEVGIDEYDTPKDLSILAVNLGGCVAWCNEAARLMGTQREGTIVGISSIAGVRGRRGQPVYGTSKAGMDHYLEALRNRLAEVGVHVSTIRPGYVDTPMTAGLGLSGAISAERAARSILRAARWRLSTCYVPFKWWAVAAIVRNIPSVLFKRLSV